MSQCSRAHRMSSCNALSNISGSINHRPGGAPAIQSAGDDVVSTALIPLIPTLSTWAIP